MTTIALRFSDSFAPDGGTIEEHLKIIRLHSYAWFGKMGTPIAKHVMQALMNNEDKKFLLINSGKADRYWVYFSDIQRTTPESEKIPEYYRFRADDFHTWFKITKIEKAPKNILSQCHVKSSGAPLSSVSRHSMSPYFIIETEEEEKCGTL